MGVVKLSLLICHTKDRAKLLEGLYHVIRPQLTKEVECIVAGDNGTIGHKRNLLLSRSKGKYVAFIDDDDSVANNYVEEVFKGIQKGDDCCSLRGIIDEKGEFSVFEHSIRHDKYLTVNPDHHDGVKYLRYPNHLNCIKADIAKKFKFKEINHGEDTDWATQIKNAKAIETEYWIEEPIYYYDPSSNRK